MKKSLGSMDLCRKVAHEVVTNGRPDVVAIEVPQVYTAVRAKGDPNQLLPLYGIGAAIGALLPNARIVEYRPAQWAGQLPKTTKHREAKQSLRGARIMSRLSETECLLVPDDHDVIDAIGIGLHHLGRLAPRRVYPGAT